jgi:hypothetical protein
MDRWGQLLHRRIAMTHIITVLVPSNDGAVQMIASEGLELSRTRQALTLILDAVREQEIRQRIRAEEAAQDPDAPDESEAPVLDG